MNITTEELDSLIDKANIQKHLLDLCSDNKNSVYRALQSLVGFYKMRKRKDCLIAIIGFVYYKIKNSNDVENILGYVKFLENYEVSAHLLKIISLDKEIHKKRLFIADFLRYISLNLHNTYTKIETEKIKKIILDSNWGTKSNTKFLNLFHDDDNF